MYGKANQIHTQSHDLYRERKQATTSVNNLHKKLIKIHHLLSYRITTKELITY